MRNLPGQKMSDTFEVSDIWFRLVRVRRKINDLLKPGGLVASAMPCIRGTCVGFLWPPLSKIGLIPPITEYNIAELEKSMTDEDFEPVGVECLQKSGQQYFIVAKKSH